MQLTLRTDNRNGPGGKYVVTNGAGDRTLATGPHETTVLLEALRKMRGGEHIDCINGANRYGSGTAAEIIARIEAKIGG
jgi:hypothetical protein